MSEMLQAGLQAAASVMATTSALWAFALLYRHIRPLHTMELAKRFADIPDEIGEREFLEGGDDMPLWFEPEAEEVLQSLPKRATYFAEGARGQQEPVLFYALTSWAPGNQWKVTSTNPQVVLEVWPSEMLHASHPAAVGSDGLVSVQDVREAMRPVSESQQAPHVLVETWEKSPHPYLRLAARYWNEVLGFPLERPLPSPAEPAVSRTFLRGPLTSLKR